MLRLKSTALKIQLLATGIVLAVALLWVVNMEAPEFSSIALLEGVTLDWYEEIIPGRTQPSGVSEDSENSVNLKRLSGLLNKLEKDLPGNIKGGELTRVTMNYFRNDSFILSVHADSAVPGHQD